MAMIQGFMDNKMGCWSQIKLDDSKVCYISVARTGVMVRQKNWLFLGIKLYEEDNLHLIAKQAMQLVHT